MSTPQYPMPQSVPEQPQQPPRAPREKRNAFGIVALVIGIVGVVFGLIPLTGIVAVALGVVAAAFAIAAWARFARRKATVGFTVAGSVVAAIALALGTWGLVIVNDTVNDLANIGNGTNAAPAPTPSASPADHTEDAADNSDEQTGPTEAVPGDVITITADDDFDGSTASADLIVTGPKYQTGPKDSFSEGPANGVFAIFKVKIKGTEGKTTFDAADMYVRIDGDRYDMDDGNAYAATDAEPLTFEEVNKGEAKTGFIVYDLPKKHGQLVYDPNFEGPPIVVWKF